jgi:hypothetical protein
VWLPEAATCTETLIAFELTPAQHLAPCSLAALGLDELLPGYSQPGAAKQWYRVIRK